MSDNIDKKTLFYEKYKDIIGISDVEKNTFTIFTDHLPRNQECMRLNHGFISFKYFGNGSVGNFKIKIERLMQKKLGRFEQINDIIHELTNSNFHVTLLRSNRSNFSDLNSVCKTFNDSACPGRTFIIVDPDTKKVVKNLNDFFIFIFQNKFYWCKIVDVKFFCENCECTFSTSGHICRNMCKKINFREFHKLYQKKLKIDIFYDIETFLEKNPEGNEVFVPGLVAFTYKVSVSDTDGSPFENHFGEFLMYKMDLMEMIDELLDSLNVRKRQIRKEDICYEIIDPFLDGTKDVMSEFVDILEKITFKVHHCAYMRLNKRVSVISFNGSKFDDLFLFASIVKKGEFCRQKLNTLSILEKGSKLLCISFCMTNKEEKISTQFRTQDLRNFLLTGSLSANAKSFDVPCQKLCFPHSLIDALRRNEVEETLESFPEYKYFEGFGGYLCSKEEYDEMKRKQEGTYDIKDIWSEYCCYDVIVLKQVYYSFMKSITSYFLPLLKKKFDPTHKLTLPSLTNALCYLHMERTFENGVRIFAPTADFLRVTYDAVYGGHCQSNAIGTLPEPENKTFFDFNGEYSGLMTGLFPYGRIETITSQELTDFNILVNEKFKNPEAKFNDLFPFLVKAKLKAPKDTRKHYCLPNVPERDSKNCLSWSNRSKLGYYYCKDIFCAIHYYDYEVEILDDPYNHKYEDWRMLFKDYVVFCQNLKITGKKEKNTIKENIGKLFGNALYGYQIKKPDRDKSQIILNRTDFTQFRHLEICGFIKITHIVCRKDIVNANCVLNKHREIQNTTLDIIDDSVDGLYLYNTNFRPVNYWTEQENEIDFPILLKYSKLNAFELECNTLPQNGVDVLSCSRLLNSELYFGMLITEDELKLPIEKRLPIVYYTDTDSFMVDVTRIMDKYYSNKNVCFNELTFKYEPWGKNEFKDKNNQDFIPKKILLAGKKLYCCIGPNNEIKCASKGVDSYNIVRESQKQNCDSTPAVEEFIKKFEKLIELETVSFKQDSMQKDFKTYSITKQCIERKLKLSDLPMICYRSVEGCDYYRPYNDEDEIPVITEIEMNAEDVFVM